MAHVLIHHDADAPKASLVVDGVDLTRSVLDLQVAVCPDGFDKPSVVTVELAADVLDLDVPQALLDAIVTKAGL
ncbi:MAG: hypothetical protein ACRDPS_01475 [Nocardioides sp.]|uniref:hypothetical protein n=1 Tax=Nocardioides sp. TaxID=35761 RepID=UPI003D6BEFAF